MEWRVFAAGLVLIMVTLSYLVREIVTTGSRPPELVVQLGTPRQVRESFQVTEASRQGRCRMRQAEAPYYVHG